MLTLLSFKTNGYRFLTLIFYSLIILIQIFFPCYLANEIKLASQKIPEKVFHSDWFLENEEHKKIVKIFLDLTKKPIQIRGFGFLVIDIGIFQKVYDAAYSMYAVFESRRKNEKLEIK
jgi:hypothetical protein